MKIQSLFFEASDSLLFLREDCPKDTNGQKIIYHRSNKYDFLKRCFGECSLQFCCMALHIGEKIRDKAREKRIGPSELGRMINTSKQNIYSIFRRKTIDTDLLVKLSEALDFDFFSYYIDKKEKLEKKPVTSSRLEISEVKKELEFYKEKCELLERLNKFLEKEVQRAGRVKKKKI